MPHICHAYWRCTPPVFRTRFFAGGVGFIPLLASIVLTAMPQSAYDLRASLINCHRSAVDFAPVEFDHRTIPLGVSSHFDKPKTSRLTGNAVPGDADILNCAVSLEH